LSIQVSTVITGPFQENTFIVFHPESREAIFIDPGDDADRIMHQINVSELKPLGIINTHAHMDHIGAVKAIQDKYRIPFYLHQDEKMILDTFEESCRTFGLASGRSPHVDHWYKDEKSISFGNVTINLLFTPGHTPGGTTFIIEDQVFAGDTLFKGSVGRTDLPGGSWQVLESSLIKLMENIDPSYTIHSGHGPITTLEDEMKENPFLISLINRANEQLA
jgi:glyoxylase-like metal-dependent hydrolase (beta-lactamase superfamily II)